VRITGVHKLFCGQCVEYFVNLILWCRRLLATGNWRLATGNWRLATGDWRLATGDWQLATEMGRWRRLARIEA